MEKEEEKRKDDEEEVGLVGGRSSICTYNGVEYREGEEVYTGRRCSHCWCSNGEIRSVVEFNNKIEYLIFLGPTKGGGNQGSDNHIF